MSKEENAQMTKTLNEQEQKEIYEACRALYSKIHSALVDLTGGLVRAYESRDKGGPNLVAEIDIKISELNDLAERLDIMCPSKQRHNQLPPIVRKDMHYETREETEP
jgi:hypothetical protein